MLAAAYLVTYECYKASYNDVREALFVYGVYCNGRLAHCDMLYGASETFMQNVSQKTWSEKSLGRSSGYKFSAWETWETYTKC
jgi:hypothetical protein